MRDRRRTFGPVVLLGIAAAGWTAIAAEKPAVDGDALGSGSGSLLALTFKGNMPLVTALALVVLACWGVILVTRGRVRRAIALLGSLAATGALVAVLVAYRQVGDDLRDALAEVGVTDSQVGHTNWYWSAVVAAIVSLLCILLATLWAPAWPEMGRRYDAPGGAAPEPKEPEEQTSLDIWKAIDEGRDPTSDGSALD